MRYSIEPKDQVYERDYGFLPSAKNMSKTIGWNHK